jgi:hypothetical protein
MNTKYLKIVLLFSILALSIHCQSVAPTVTNYWSNIQGTSSPYSSTYNRATNTYIISHAGPTGNEIVMANVINKNLVFKFKGYYPVVHKLEASRDDARVALINEHGEITVIWSQNNWDSFKTIWTNVGTVPNGNSIKLRWYDGTDYLFVGKTDGTACAFLIEQKGKRRDPVCKQILGGGVFGEIIRKPKSDLTYFLEGVDTKKVWLANFFDTDKFKVTFDLKANTRFLVPDRTNTDMFYAFHNNDDLYSYQMFDRVCEHQMTKDLMIPEALVDIQPFRNTEVLLVYSLNTLVIVATEGLEEVGRHKFKAPGFADPLTWSYGESDGYASIFQRVVEPQGRWWNWQIAFIDHDRTKAVKPATETHSATTRFSHKSATKKAVKNNKKSAAKKIKPLMHLLNKKSANIAK